MDMVCPNLFLEQDEEITDAYMNFSGSDAPSDSAIPTRPIPSVMDPTFAAE
jgi:hypothetical protein